MSESVKLRGRPQWMREMRASYGADPDGRTSLLARLMAPRAKTVEVIDMVGEDEGLAEKVASASRADTNGRGGQA
jgi:hypothetical protein